MKILTIAHDKNYVGGANRSLDYNSVHERLKKVRQESLEYLKRVLEDVSETE